MITANKAAKANEKNARFQSYSNMKFSAVAYILFDLIPYTYSCIYLKKNGGLFVEWCNGFKCSGELTIANIFAIRELANCLKIIKYENESIQLNEIPESA